MIPHRLLLLVVLAVLSTACDKSFLHKITAREPATDVTCAPNAGVDTLAAAIATDRVTLSWTSPASNEDGFIIYRGKNRQSPTELFRTLPDATTYDDTDVQLGDIMAYEVTGYRTVNAETCETDSANLAQVTAYPQPLLPGQVDFNQISGTRLDVVINDADNYGTTGYHIFRRDGPTGSFQELAASQAPAQQPPGITTFPQSGMTVHTTYTYQISVINETGESAVLEKSVFTVNPPVLDWTGPALIGRGCVFDSPGRATYDTVPDPDAEYHDGAGSAVSVCGTLMPSPDGLHCSVSDLLSTTVSTTWSVTDSYGATSEISRDLGMATVADAVFGPTQRPNATEPGFVGRQNLWETCTTCGGHPGGLALGDYHTCVINLDSTVSCWGENVYTDYYGNYFANEALGTGAPIYSPNPLLACGGGSVDPCDTDLAGVLELSSGWTHNCVVTASHAALCWGDNAYGELGDGSLAPRGVPTRVCSSGAGPSCVPLTGVASISAAEGWHTCAIMESSQEVRCWGLNDHGQLGSGDAQLAYSANPLRVCLSGADSTADCTPLTGAIAVTTGEATSCAVLGNGHAYCWGAGEAGQRGDGTGQATTVAEVTRPSPVCARGSDCVAPFAGLSSLAGSGSTICGLAAGGTLLCWGNNYAGQLGIGTWDAQAFPGPVCSPDTGENCTSPAVMASVAVGAVAGDNGHTCAIANPGGRLYCWGSNHEGELGIGEEYQWLDVPFPTAVCVTGSMTGGDCVQLSGVTAVAVGEAHSCAVLSSGEARCWGANYDGQIGLGPVAGLTNVLRPLPVCAAGASWDGTRCGVTGSPGSDSRLTGVQSMAVGSNFTCARVTDGSVFCWGANAHGQLGDGSSVTRSANPVQVCLDEDGACSTTAFDGTTALVAGGTHACALTASPAGGIYCWGENVSGELGDGTGTDRNMATPVCTSDAWNGTDCGSGLALTNVEQVTAGTQHTCARLADGSLVCWGGNTGGALGVDQASTALAFSANPMSVCVPSGTCDPIADVEDVAAGENITCAGIGTGHDVYCWGANAGGQPIAVVPDADSAWPRQVCADGAGGTCTTALSGATAIAAGDDHVCALVTGGEVQCWGDDANEQLGLRPTTTPSFVANPFPVCASGAWNGSTCDSGGSKLMGVKALSAGGLRTCAIDSSNAVVCWGDSYYGELGNCDSTSSRTPVPVGVGSTCATALGDVAAIDVGTNHACAVRQTLGDVVCWGTNDYGELGLGLGANGTHYAATVCASGGVETSDCTTLEGMSMIAAGGAWTCGASTSSKTVSCWGDNSHGLLAQGSPYYIDAEPALVCARGYGRTCEPLQNVVQLAARGATTCAVTTTGTVSCWGRGGFNQRGAGIQYEGDDPTYDPYYDPPPVPTNPNDVCLTGTWNGSACRDGSNNSTLTGAVTVVVGGDFLGGAELPDPAPYVSDESAHACAIVDASGHVRCWGANYYGQLGNSQSGNVDPTMTPVEVTCSATGTPGCSTSALTNVVALAAGFAHTCALIDTGHVKCWGLNEKAALGTGAAGDEANPADVMLNSTTPLSDAVAITAGWQHTCALRRDSSVLCWGYNEDGELGTGAWGGGALYPAVVCDTGTGSGCTPLQGVAAIAAGTWSTCAVMNDTSVKCWGYARGGLVGDGTTGPATPGLYGMARLNPTVVCAPDAAAYCGSEHVCTAPLTGIVAIAGGLHHFCGLTATNGVVCWGSEYRIEDYGVFYPEDGGQRGIGTMLPQDRTCAPHPVCQSNSGRCASATPYADANLMQCDTTVITP